MTGRPARSSGFAASIRGMSSGQRTSASASASAISGSDVRDREPAGDVGAGKQVDPARVGEVRDHDRRGAVEQLAQIRARGEQLADRRGEPRRALLALALGDLDDDRAEPAGLPSTCADRVEVGEPVTLDAGLGRGLAGDLDVGDRRARSRAPRCSMPSTFGPTSGSTSETRRPRWSSIGSPLMSASGWFSRT